MIISGKSLILLLPDQKLRDYHIYGDLSKIKFNCNMRAILININNAFIAESEL